jgi:hypothetical protein
MLVTVNHDGALFDKACAYAICSLVGLTPSRASRKPATVEIQLIPGTDAALKNSTLRIAENHSASRLAYRSIHPVKDRIRNIDQRGVRLSKLPQQRIIDEFTATPCFGIKTMMKRRAAPRCRYR